MIKGWQVDFIDRVGNVMPVNDLKKHREGLNCWCNPKSEIQIGGEEVITHNSADMREYVLEGKNKVKS